MGTEGEIVLAGLIDTFDKAEEYEVLGPLQHGRFCEIVEVRHPNGAVLARQTVKTFDAALATSLLATNHRNIAAVLGVVPTPEGQVYVFHEHISYTIDELRHVCGFLGNTNNSLAPAQLDSLVYQGLQGLHAMQKLKIASFNINRYSVLVTSEGVVKFAQFQHGAVFDKPNVVVYDNKQLGDLAEFRAPEMIDRDGYELCSDWWGFGILCMEQLAGDFELGDPFRVLMDLGAFRKTLVAAGQAVPRGLNATYDMLQTSPLVRRMTPPEKILKTRFEGYTTAQAEAAMKDYVQKVAHASAQHRKILDHLNISPAEYVQPWAYGFVPGPLAPPPNPAPANEELPHVPDAAASPACAHVPSSPPASPQLPPPVPQDLPTDTKDPEKAPAPPDAPSDDEAPVADVCEFVFNNGNKCDKNKHPDKNFCKGHIAAGGKKKKHQAATGRPQPHK